MNTEIKVRLIHAGGEEVQALWRVLATIRNHGFRTVSPIVRSGLAGSFLLATLVYVGGDEVDRTSAIALLRETVCAE